MSQSKENDVVASGINANDFIDLSSRAALCDVFDLSNRYTEDYKNCEEALLYKTYFTDSPTDADRIIKNKFAFDEKQLKALKRISCKGWATISKEFLMLRGADQDGVVLDTTIMDHLENGEGNLMQIIHDEKYNYQAVLDAHEREYFRDKTNQEIVDEMIDAMPPKMRRPVIQALRIVREVSKVAKKKPDVISIEVTREANDKKAKDAYSKKAEDRKKQLTAFLNGLCKNDVEKDRALTISKELEGFADINPLRGKHLFLYFLQNGKDAYTGEPIDINEVLNGTKYDTDHIIPQSMIKDDSIENLVLVKREINQHRSNEYPLPENIRSNKSIVAFWRRLKKAGMMSDKKFNNLTRVTRLTENELQAFVAAQINVVNHSNVVIRDALKVLYPNAKLIFSKAQYPSQIRHELGIPKLRDLNDTHHAVDAYLNVVAGVKLQERFGNMAVIKAAAQNDENHSLNMEGYINHLIIKNDESGPTAFGEKINKISLRHDFLLTYRFAYQDNAFYDGTIYKNQGKADSLIAIHDGWDVTKYGGYKKYSIESQVIATIKKGKNTTKYLLGVPHVLKLEIDQGKKPLDKLSNLLDLKAGETAEFDLGNMLPLKMTVSKDGVRYLLNSYEGDNVSLLPVSPIFLGRDEEMYLMKLIKLVEKDLRLAASTHSTELFDPKRSAVIARKLFEMADDKRYDYCKKIADIRDHDFQKDLFESLENATLVQQKDILIALLARFTRKCASYNDKPFKKSRGKILNDGFKACSSSITGLFETPLKL